MSTAEKKIDAVEALSDGATNISDTGRGADKESKGQNYQRQHSDSADRGGQVSCVLSKCRGLLEIYYNICTKTINMFESIRSVHPNQNNSRVYKQVI